MRYKIQVTKEDIKNGIRNDTCSCPIALACKKALKTNEIDVGETKLYVQNCRYNIPKKVQNFISCFDTGKKVKPFSFYVKVD